MGTVAEVVDQVRDYLNISTNIATLSKRKYLQIIRKFLMHQGMKFTVSDINRYIKESNKDKNCYTHTYAFRYLLMAIGKKKMIDSLVTVKKKPRKKIFKYVPKETIQKVINMLPKKYKFLALLQ